jgi:hypothetical protein
MENRAQKWNRNRRYVRLLTAIVPLTAAMTIPSWGQEMLAPAEYSREVMEQALQTREHYDLHGLHFDANKSTLRAGSGPLLDDIATTLKNFPEWGLRIVGHTDSSGKPEANQALSLARADAIKAALVERGVDSGRLYVAGAGETQPIANDSTSRGRSLNRRVELVRFSDSEAAKGLLKGMSDYMAAQKSISFEYDATLQIVTGNEQKIGLASSGAVILARPDKLRTMRSGGIVDVETVFDGKTLTLLGKNLNKYTQVEIPGTVDHLIDELKDKYGLPLPGADLLLTNSYDQLMEGVYDSKDMGTGIVNGAECDSLAFRKDDVDFQIWVASGPQPYPCKFVITSTAVEGAPEYSVQIRNWKSGDAIASTDFSFKNEANAEKIDLKDIQGSWRNCRTPLL